MTYIPAKFPIEITEDLDRGGQDKGKDVLRAIDCWSVIVFLQLTFSYGSCSVSSYSLVVYGVLELWVWHWHGRGWLYGRLAFFSGTHKTNKLNMPLSCFTRMLLRPYGCPVHSEHLKVGLPSVHRGSPECHHRHVLVRLSYINIKKPPFLMIKTRKSRYTLARVTAAFLAYLKPAITVPHPIDPHAPAPPR